jgi:hypothetical protein
VKLRRVRKAGDGLRADRRALPAQRQVPHPRRRLCREHGLKIDFYYPQLPALAALLSGLFVGVFAGLLPARSAARKDIVEAVQYV